MDCLSLPLPDSSLEEEEGKGPAAGGEKLSSDDFLLLGQRQLKPHAMCKKIFGALVLNNVIELSRRDKDYNMRLVLLVKPCPLPVFFFFFLPSLVAPLFTMPTLRAFCSIGSSGTHECSTVEAWCGSDRWCKWPWRLRLW